MFQTRAGGAQPALQSVAEGADLGEKLGEFGDWRENVWGKLVEAIAYGMTTFGGSAAWGIFLTTTVVRAALIPVMLPMAIRTRERQLIVRRIRPQIKALDKELKHDPGLLQKKLTALHEQNGIKVVDWPGLLAALIQLPILIALFQAVLLVSEGTQLESGGLVWGLVAAALAVYGTWVSGQSEGAKWLLWMSGILPVAISVWLGAGIGLYLTAFYVGGAVQGMLMRRSMKTGNPRATPQR